MLQLFTDYTVSEIILFLIIFAIAFKGVVSFGDWAAERFRKIIHKESKQEQYKQHIEDQLKNNEQSLEQLEDKQEQLEDQLNKIMDKINILISSDRDDIKSFITKEHHYFCYQKGWIDDYSLDCIEKRYNIYKAEDGNSFIHTLMQEIRALDKHPAKKLKEEKK